MTTSDYLNAGDGCCVACGEPGYPTCGAGACLRIWRFMYLQHPGAR